MKVSSSIARRHFSSHLSVRLSSAKRQEKTVQTCLIYATVLKSTLLQRNFMKRSFLARLQRSARLSLVGSLLLLLVVPSLQLFVLGSQGYGAALAMPQTSLFWIQGHTALFLLYRVALLLGFALLLGMPFALFRVIIAQEIVERAELEREERAGNGAEEEEESDARKRSEGALAEESNGMPAFAWRGKGFAVIAAWAGLVGLSLATGGTLFSTIYLWSSASIASAQAPVPGNFASVTSLFALLTYAFGGGLLAFACIFFGFVIARSGRRLWPDSWVAFGYAGLGIGAIASGGAVQVALAPLSGQATLTTFALLLFAAWVLWFSLMLVGLKPE
jgi:hypothetical protein